MFFFHCSPSYHVLDSAPAKFVVQNFYQKKMRASSISPLRVTLDIEEDLSSAGSIEVALGANYNIPQNTVPLCTLRDQETFERPVLVQCVYNTAANTYTLNLLDGIPQGRYLIQITNLHQNLATNNGLAFPADTHRTSVTVRVKSSNNLVSQDMIFIAPMGSKLFYLSFSLTFIRCFFTVQY